MREIFGSGAQTVINMLLAWDAYLAWYYPYKKSIPFLCDTMEREARAFDNMRTAVDMMEIFERASVRNHGSFLIHGAVYKCTRDILTVGNPWAVDLSPLELQNAETKRTASAGGARHLEFGEASKVRAPALKLTEAPAKLVSRKGYSTTMAVLPVSTLKKLLCAQNCRRGDGEVAFADSRRTERLLGNGRTKPVAAGANEAKRVKTYDPFEDTCVKAFVRLLAERGPIPTFEREVRGTRPSLDACS